MIDLYTTLDVKVTKGKRGCGVREDHALRKASGTCHPEAMSTSNDYWELVNCGRRREKPTVIDLYTTLDVKVTRGKRGCGVHEDHALRKASGTCHPESISTSNDYWSWLIVAVVGRNRR